MVLKSNREVNIISDSFTTQVASEAAQFVAADSPRRLVSVSVGPEGDLHDALLGPTQAYGTEASFGDVPGPILDLIHRVQAA